MNSGICEVCGDPQLCNIYNVLISLSQLLFSHSVMSDSFRPHGLQHTRLLCPSLPPRACSNSCPLSRWCHSTISTSVIPFSSCPQFFPTSGSFPVSWFFTSGGQSIEACFSISPSNEYSGLISFRIDWFDLLVVQGTLKSLLQHCNLKATVLHLSAFFMVQLSHSLLTSGKTITFSRQTFVSKVGWQGWGFPGGSGSKKSACNVGDPGSIPGLGRYPGEGHGNPLQYSHLESPTDRGAWGATVRGVSQSQSKMTERLNTLTWWKQVLWLLGCESTSGGHRSKGYREMGTRWLKPTTSTWFPRQASCKSPGSRSLPSPWESAWGCADSQMWAEVVHRGPHLSTRWGHQKGWPMAETDKEEPPGRGLQ